MAINSTRTKTVMSAGDGVRSRAVKKKVGPLDRIRLMIAVIDDEDGNCST